MKKTILTCLVLSAMSVQAHQQQLTCANYKEKLLGQTFTTIEGGVLDCSAERADADLITCIETSCRKESVGANEKLSKRC
jgi:hypothetical protein